MDKQELCPLEDIENDDAVGMVARVAGKQRNIFVIRREATSMLMSTGVLTIRY